MSLIICFGNSEGLFQTRFIVVTYDIASNKLRNRVAKCLEQVGNRVQYSVFECDLTLKQFHQLKSRLEMLLKRFLRR